MALAFSYRASVYSTTAGAIYQTTTPYTPAQNSLLVAFVVGCGGTQDPNAATPFSGHGVTWTKKTLSANAIGSTHALSCWVANAGASPTSAAATAQWTTNRTGAAIIEFEITGWDHSLAAVDALIQAVTNTGSGTSGTLTLAAAANSNNRPMAFFVHLANEPTTHQAQWTEPIGAEGSFAAPVTSAGAQYRTDAFQTTASASWSTSSSWRGIALEIAASLSIALTAGSLAFTGQSVGAAFQAPSTGTLTITGTIPGIGGSNPSVVLPEGTLAITGASVGVGFSAPSTGVLTLTGTVTTLGGTPGGGPTLPMPAGSLTADGGYVGVLFTGPDVGFLTFTGQAPLVNATVKPMPAGALAFTGQALTLGGRVALSAGTLTASGHALTVVTPLGAFGVPQAILTLTGQTPTRVIGIGSRTISLPSGSLSLTTYAGAIHASEGILSIVVHGVPRPFLANTLNRTDDLNARNTLSVSFWDGTGTWHPSCGETLILYSGGGVEIFAGTVDEPVEESILGQATGYKVHLTAVDYNQIADRHLVIEAYDDTSFVDIVTDLIVTYLGPDGVIVGVIDVGPTFVRKVFNYRPAAECFNELSEDTGYSWWISNQKVFHFRERAAVVAPFAVTSTNSTVSRLSVRTSRGPYRNRQFIRAGRDLTDPITESFKGDGTRQTFTVGFPIGMEPLVLVNGIPQTIGIRGVESELAFDWYWNKDSNEVTQRAGSVPPSTTDVVDVTFRGLFPVLIQAQDNNEIADRQAVEGGSGLYEAIEDLPDIDSADLAFDTAVAKLHRNGMIRQTVQFETIQDGLASGQLISIVWPSHQLNGDYLIQSVSAHDAGASFMRYTVTAMDGDAVGGWIAFYQRLMAKRRDSVQRDNELLLQLRAMSDGARALDALDVDFPIAKETRIGLAQIGRSEIGTTP